MSKLAVVLSLFSISVVATEQNNDSTYSFAVGAGAPYAGLGGHVAKVSDTDMKYLSLGCIQYSSLMGSACGLGAGWMVTDLFDATSNKHGFGVYALQNAGEEIASRGEGVFAEYQFQRYSALGLNYTYFSNGINQSGFTFGLSIHATNADYDEKINGMFQIGYQF
jgi:hypothetical protein